MTGKNVGITTPLAVGLSVLTLVIGLVVGGLLLGPALTQVVGLEGEGLRGEILVGALLPLTGDLASYGENSRAAIELAEKEVNDYLRSIGAGFTIKVLVEDTETKPETADSKLKSLHARGVKLFVGPQTSAEIRRIKSYADANKLVLISQSSTAPDLAIPGDYIFRFCPDDTIQGPIGPRLAKALGLTHIIYVWRGDAWGDGLYRSSSEEAKKLGLTIVEGVRYAPEKKEFSAEAKLLSDKVKELVGKGVSPDKILIEYIAFGEAVVFFSTVADYPELARVKWFGSDGTAQLAELLKEPKAAGFAATTKGIHPIFAATASDKNKKVTDYVKSKLGREPDSYAYAAYDAVWVLALALLQTGKYDGEAIQKALPTVAGNYFGATGWINLNPAGDLAFADYVLWTVQRDGDRYEWRNIGLYSFAAGTFSWSQGFTP